MATLLLQAAGAALGSVFGPVGAIIGRAAGALAGNAIDRAVIGGGSSTTVKGSQLSSARIAGAEEGTAVNRVYGTMRIGGTLIWATRFQEEVTTATQRSGGKGSSSSSSKVTTYSYYYYANVAIGLCEGPIAGVRRVWADGQELDLTTIEMRIHTGAEDQAPDPLIEAKQGAGNAPAYRGLAYVVFEHFPLETYGNRIPILQFEVMRPAGRLESLVKAITVTPGATEYGYSPVAIKEQTGQASARTINRNVLTRATDWEASIDELMAVCPNLERVALVVAWFGTDLRAGECRIVPGVELSARQKESVTWKVSGISRGAAHLVSRIDGEPALGGTPDDASVVAAITDLKVRGLEVFLYPFVMMDIPAGNGRADPYCGTEQDAYPWRGRITCHPAAGIAGSVDGTAAARTQVNGFCGSATAGNFTTSGTTVTYHGSDQGYRRMILHYAKLAKAAGGVAGFILGSELRGLTRVRDETGGFPFVSALVTLAADVRAIVGASTKLTYAADWSEYFGYHPADGSGDVFFNLDPLWASPNIDAVGIDNYMPLADWRDDDLVAANPDGLRLADDADGLKAAITSGEGYDWYYAGDAARANRSRSPIADGLAGKPWVYRYKDIEGWWVNRHYDRHGGAEAAEPTAWLPGMKPVWFTELGCAAIDKAANQPNVFFDPKSSENAAPYFSNATRSDSVQRRFLEAHHDWWTSEEAPAGMVDPGRMFLWTWDARPFPTFPFDTSVWSDGDNWRTGHWLNGRLGTGTLAGIIGAVLTDHGFADFDVSQVSGNLTGYVQSDVTTARSLLEPLIDVFQLDVFEDGGRLTFRSRAKASLPARDMAVLVDEEDQPLWEETRGHVADYAGEALVTYYDAALDYEQAGARSRRVAAANDRVLSYSLVAALPQEEALLATDGLLRDHRISRRSVTFAVSPTMAALQPGDVVRLPVGPEGRFLVTRIEDGDSRSVEAREVVSAPGLAPPAESARRHTSGSASASFSPIVHLMDLPRYGGDEASEFARIAVTASPWKTVTVSASATTEGYSARALLTRPAIIGTLGTTLGGGVPGRFDHSQALEVDLAFGSFASAEKATVLNGGNLIAVRSSAGSWELCSFLNAEETAADHWRLTGLLRGLAGTEDAMAAGAEEGTAVVLIDDAVAAIGLTAAERGLERNWIVETADGMAGPFAFTGGERAETPLAPVHLRAVRRQDGTIRITWVRRGRIEADSWLSSEIPLDEETEAYRLDILSGGLPVRTVEVASPVFEYAGADEVADFGAPQAALAIRVRQLGRKVPLGIPAERLISL
ncbi:baseplate multidomain protein megatron [Rhizobium sp. PAMB 3182]